MLHVISVIAGAMVALAANYWFTRREREIHRKREEFLKDWLRIADAIPGGKEKVTIPYNTFCREGWVEEYAKHYPRKEYRASVGVVESR